MASLLHSQEFKQEVGDWAYPVFQAGLKMCTEQFVDGSLLPAHNENFLDFDRVIALFPDESTENKESSPEK